MSEEMVTSNCSLVTRVDKAKTRVISTNHKEMAYTKLLYDCESNKGISTYKNYYFKRDC